VLVAAYFLGVDPRLVMGVLQDPGVQDPPTQASTTSGPPADDAGDFAVTVLGFTEDVWGKLFSESGRRYSPAGLILFGANDRVDTGCGPAVSAVGPFYCPADEKVYIDLGFFNELVRRFGGPREAAQTGNLAQAYVIAHEVGHHVQKLTGIADRVHGEQQRASEQETNALQVRMELQADCYAGVWAHYEQDRLEFGEIDNALAAAAAVGDDTIQKKTQGRVVPESFTHGSAAQRQRWFGNGFANGKPGDCDTFGAQSL
jgi:hypothetical protein